MATYTITLNERSAKGKALMEYLKALGVMHKVSPKSATTIEKRLKIDKAFREELSSIENSFRLKQ